MLPKKEELSVYAKYFMLIACIALATTVYIQHGENKSLYERLLKKQEGDTEFYKDAYFNLTRVLKDK